jgi:hypothetical protein
MFLTATIMKEQLNINTNININFDYCIGYAKQVIKRVCNNIFITDAIIVWEHKEIIDIIRSFDISIKKWKNKYSNNYDIVFMIDLKTKQLFYDCFDYTINISSCSKNIEVWLNNFDKIENYYKYYKNNLGVVNKIDETSNITKPPLYLIILFSVFLYSFLCFCIYFTIKRITTNTRRDGYVVIN